MLVPHMNNIIRIFCIQVQFSREIKKTKNLQKEIYIATEYK